LLQGRIATAAHSGGVGHAVFAGLRYRRGHRDQSKRRQRRADAVIIFAIDFTLCSPFPPLGLAERCRPACACGRVGISTRTKKWNRLFGINKEWPAFSSPNCPPSRRRAGRGCRPYQRFRASDRRSDFDGRRMATAIEADIFRRGRRPAHGARSVRRDGRPRRHRPPCRHFRRSRS
jgi:hypothetical protein